MGVLAEQQGGLCDWTGVSRCLEGKKIKVREASGGQVMCGLCQERPSNLT